MKRFCLFLTVVVLLCSSRTRAADLAYINQRIAQAEAGADCAKTTFWTMVAAQTYDYITSYRNFEHGYVEADPINKRFTQVFQNTKIGLAVGLTTVDLIGMRVTRRSTMLRCAFQTQRTAASLIGAIHNNAIGGEYRP